jgi:hypothetical protein
VTLTSQDSNTSQQNSNQAFVNARDTLQRASTHYKKATTDRDLSNRANPAPAESLMKIEDLNEPKVIKRAEDIVVYRGMKMTFE